MEQPEDPSLQERFAPDGVCFGCGPANPKGLHIRSVPRGEEVVCQFTPEPCHEAFEGFLNGGIIGTLMDCHMNWTAAWRLMQRDGLARPPTTVTLEFQVRLRRPTPARQGPVTLVARTVEAQADRAIVECELWAQGQKTATGRGTFVAVGPGHAAYGRW
ncbi:PaaI family thioesterase [Myxococcota bacterium]|nr:PaaI family thioesterase [Myxococcota bacterium]